MEASTLVQKNPVDLVIEQFANTVDQTNIVRRELRQKLLEGIRATNFADETMKASMLLAKLGMVEKVEQLLTGEENSIQNKAKLTLRKKETESDAQVGKSVVELLKIVKTNQIPSNSGNGTSLAAADAAIEEAFKAQCSPIAETELEEIPAPSVIPEAPAQ